MLTYWKGLIAWRRSEAGGVFRVGTAVPDGYYQWLLPGDEHLLGYVVARRVLVLINTSDRAMTFANVSLPAGNWRLIGNSTTVDHLNGVAGPHQLLSGNRIHQIPAPRTSIQNLDARGLKRALQDIDKILDFV